VSAPSVGIRQTEEFTMRIVLITVVACVLVHRAVPCRGETDTAGNLPAPTPNRADEPLAVSFSLDAATQFLDRASLHWTRSRRCFACHTNFLYLVARPAISADAPAHREIRAALEALVAERWLRHGPRWDAEVVMTAAVLALNDASTTGQLHATTRQALDRMWQLQRADGGVDWLKCGWPPMESDDDFGATMMALAVAAAPAGYRRTEPAREGLARLRDYFARNPPPTLHHRAMLLWADSYGLDLLGPSDREETIRELLDLQKDNGGWNVATLGNWDRADGQPQDVESSNGYGTGFAIYVLRRAGLPADHPQLRRGIGWLRANQRASGRWFTRSLNKDTTHYLTHAGSAMAVLAIQACQPASG
jgi:squalene-hopene/tetraprenyl-beta-curcumene cyclase